MKKIRSTLLRAASRGLIALADLAVQFHTNARDVADFVVRLEQRINQRGELLLTSLSKALEKRVKDRITTQGEGEWKPAGKWIQGKKNTTKALEGTERYIKSRVATGVMAVYGDMPGEWTFTQHGKGFINKLYEERELVREGVVAIKIVNPAPLGMSKPRIFEFAPKKTGVTPPRRVWLTEAETIKEVTPRFQAWLRQVVREAGARDVHG